MRALAICFTLLATLTMFRCDSTPPPPHFVIVDLGSTARFRSSKAFGINDGGEVVGALYNPVNASDTTSQMAFYWREMRLNEIGTLGGFNSQAMAIDERSHVVGWSQTSGGDEHAFEWENGRTPPMFDLDRNTTGTSPLGVSQSRATGVVWNGSGAASTPFIAVGNAANPSGDRVARAVLANYSAISSPRPLLRIVFVDSPSFSGGSRANGVAMVERISAIVGEREVGQGIFHAFLQHANRFRDLGTFRGTDSALLNSEAFDVSTQGNVVGYSEVSDTRDGTHLRHAFLYTGVMLDLGTLPGGGNSEARALTDTARPARVVGYSEFGPGTAHHAVMWYALTPYDLNGDHPDHTPFVRSLGHWELIEAYGINNSNWIVGWGILDGEERAFLLRPS
jgi:probable HAF family extracellular repeat protein